jgi:hypothetical protein
VKVVDTLTARQGSAASGAITLTYRGNLNAANQNIWSAANVFACRCNGIDSAGTCGGSPPSCEVAPVFTAAKVKGPAAIEPIALAPCVGCPNGVKEGSEQCDDGNFKNDDECANDCTGSCGNGTLDAGEQCDTGVDNGHGCCTTLCTWAVGGPCADDGNPCTDDVCQPNGGCGTFNTAACDDGDPCTSDDACDGGGACIGGASTCEQAGVVLLLDTSGSMSLRHDGKVAMFPDEQRIAKAKNAADLFVDLLASYPSKKPHLGIAVFPAQPFVDDTCEAQVVEPLSILDPAAAKAAIDGLPVSGFTPLLAGLDKVRGMFSTEKSRVVVLLSDGYHNCPSAVTVGDTAVNDLVQQLSEQGTQVHTIGFAEPGEPDLWLLSTLASGTGGQFYDVTKPLADPAAWKQWIPAAALSDAYAKVLGDSLGLAPAIDPFGTLQGQTATSHPLALTEYDRAVSVILDWTTPQIDRLDLTVKSSDGQTVGTGARGLALRQSATYKVFTVDSSVLKQPGKMSPTPWQIDIGAAGVPKDQREKFHYAVLLDSSLKLNASAAAVALHTGQPFLLTARVTEGGKPVANLQSVAVRVSRPRESLGDWYWRLKLDRHKLLQAPGARRLSPRALVVEALRTRQPTPPRRVVDPALPLYDDGTHGDVTAGDGTYTNLFANTTKEGTYAFYFSVKSTTPGGHSFERERTVQQYLSPVVDGHRSQIHLQAAAGQPGRMTLTVTPRDAFGNRIGPLQRSALSVTTSAGRFEGRLIDDLNGLYRQTLVLPRNVRPTAATISVSSRGIEHRESPRSEKRKRRGLRGALSHNAAPRDFFRR